MAAWLVGGSGILVLAASLAAPAPAQTDRAIKCEGPFARNATHNDLVKAFGAANVRYTDIPSAEGQTEKGTVVFPNNPKARLDIFWANEKARRQPSIRIRAPSEWRAPNGIRIGTALAEIERTNGKPFKLAGFGWDYGGNVLSFEKGALDKPQPGGCIVGLTFNFPDDIPSAAQEKVSGDIELLSNNPAVRAVKPAVSSIFIGYPQK
jgi:hypothetical protein